MRISEPAVTGTQNPQETWCQYNCKNGQCPVAGSSGLAEGEKASRDSGTAPGGTEHPERMGFGFAGGSLCFESETNTLCTLSHSQHTQSRI